jgi:LmbE family N-acetylglucosaminyl deacetylase
MPGVTMGAADLRALARGDRLAIDVRRVLGLPDLLSVKRVVCVQPHPDDNEVGAAGTLIQLAQAGCEVVCVTVTDGRAGGAASVQEQDALVARRAAERIRAGQLCGVARQHAFTFEDAGDYEEAEVRRELIRVLRAERPDLVMTVDPWLPYEMHPDHVKTGLAAVRATVFAGNAAVMPEAGRPVLIPQVALYATSWPNTYVDVSAVWERKKAAILAHESQFAGPEWELTWGYLDMEAQRLYQQFREQLLVLDRASSGVSAGNGSAEAAPGRAEAFKVLALQQLHFFPQAVFS